ILIGSCLGSFEDPTVNPVRILARPCKIYSESYILTVLMTGSFCFLLYVLSDHALRLEKGHTHFGKPLKSSPYRRKQYVRQFTY
ncbi:hypothetical protein P5673_020979, partial [Acropora cervicornis]